MDQPWSRHIYYKIFGCSSERLAPAVVARCRRRICLRISRVGQGKSVSKHFSWFFALTFVEKTLGFAFSCFSLGFMLDLPPPQENYLHLSNLSHRPCFARSPAHLLGTRISFPLSSMHPHVWLCKCWKPYVTNCRHDGFDERIGTPMKLNIIRLDKIWSLQPKPDNPTLSCFWNCVLLFVIVIVVWLAWFVLATIILQYISIIGSNFQKDGTILDSISFACCVSTWSFKQAEFLPVGCDGYILPHVWLRQALRRQSNLTGETGNLWV